MMLIDSYDCALGTVWVMSTADRSCLIKLKTIQFWSLADRPLYLYYTCNESFKNYLKLHTSFSGSFTLAFSAIISIKKNKQNKIHYAHI